MAFRVSPLFSGRTQELVIYKLVLHKIFTCNLLDDTRRGLKPRSKGRYYKHRFIVTRLMELTCETLYFRMTGVEQSVFYEYITPPCPYATAGVKFDKGSVNVSRFCPHSQYLGRSRLVYRGPRTFAQGE